MRAKPRGGTERSQDDCTRECPAILVDFSLSGHRVVTMLEDVARERGHPDMLVVDRPHLTVCAPEHARSDGP